MGWLKGSEVEFKKELKKKKQQEEREKKQALAKERQEMEEQNKRFKLILEEEISGGRQFEIIKDRKTGVCYLWRRSSGSNSSGFTVLLDNYGNPTIEDIEL